MNYFYLDESPSNVGKYMIRLNFTKLPASHTKGSYNILLARMLGLTYAEFLRYCRDFYGAEIIGKGTYYPVPYFSKDSNVNSLIKLLNENATKVFKVKKENENG